MIAQLHTTDLAESIRFYTTKVGLALAFQYQDFYAGIRAGDQLFHLKRVDETDPTIEFVDRGEHFHLYLETDDAAATAAALRERGVPFVKDLHETPWGTREFAVKDDQGHTLYFGQDLSRLSVEQLLERTYAAFNARDSDRALAAMHPDVAWPNRMEGGHVHGHPGIREYWARQWGLIDPRVEPRGFAWEPDGRVAVDVHQVVRDLSGKVVKDEMVRHVYRLEGGLIRSMEIRSDASRGA